MRDFTKTLYKCPNCGSYISRGLGSFSDCITILGVYSDGFESTTGNDYFDIVECGECKSIVKLSQLETIEVDLYSHKEVKYALQLVKERKIEDLSSLLKELKQTEPIVEYGYCRSLDISGLYKAIKEFPEDELAIRLRIWRKYNDVFRQNSSDAYVRFALIGKDYNDNNSIIDDSIIDTKEYRDNCFALLELLKCVCSHCGYDNIEPDFNYCPICSHSLTEQNPTNIYRVSEDKRLLLAEINRNLGNFAECAELVRHSAIGESIEMIQLWECEKNNRRPIRIDNCFEILREKARQEAERKEQEWLEEEKKDSRWKVCPNGHCFENIRKKCIWCGEKAIVDRLDKDISLQHKELYVGKQNGHYVLTVDVNIPMQEERIRKITVDYYQDKFIYFHLDGKNPNPFYLNEIKLSEGHINGRILTKLCEDIVSGKIDYADLSSYIKAEISK